MVGRRDTERQVESMSATPSVLVGPMVAQGPGSSVLGGVRDAGTESGKPEQVTVIVVHRGLPRWLTLPLTYRGRRTRGCPSGPETEPPQDRAKTPLTPILVEQIGTESVTDPKTLQVKLPLNGQRTVETRHLTRPVFLTVTHSAGTSSTGSYTSSVPCLLLRTDGSRPSAPASAETGRLTRGKTSESSRPAANILQQK